MRKLVVGGLALAALTAAGCAESEVTTKPDKQEPKAQGGQTQKSTDSVAEEPKAKKPEIAHVGGTITLAADSAEIKATLVSVTDPIKPEGRRVHGALDEPVLATVSSPSRCGSRTRARRRSTPTRSSTRRR